METSEKEFHLCSCSIYPSTFSFISMRWKSSRRYLSHTHEGLKKFFSSLNFWDAFSASLWLSSVVTRLLKWMYTKQKWRDESFSTFCVKEENVLEFLWETTPSASPRLGLSHLWSFGTWLIDVGKCQFMKTSMPIILASQSQSSLLFNHYLPDLCSHSWPYAFTVFCSLSLRWWLKPRFSNFPTLLLLLYLFSQNDIQSLSVCPLLVLKVNVFL
jgi:hypothetical protein